MDYELAPIVGRRQRTIKSWILGLLIAALPMPIFLGLSFGSVVLLQIWAAALVVAVHLDLPVFRAAGYDQAARAGLIIGVGLPAGVVTWFVGFDPFAPGSAFGSLGLDIDLNHAFMFALVVLSFTLLFSTGLVLRARGERREYRAFLGLLMASPVVAFIVFGGFGGALGVVVKFLSILAGAWLLGSAVLRVWRPATDTARRDPAAPSEPASLVPTFQPYRVR